MGEIKISLENGWNSHKFNTVVIDFPWEVKNNLTNLKFYRTGKKMPYGMIPNARIETFPIDYFCEDRCDLFLWTITSKIHFCFDLFDLWGFKFMDFFTWDKLIGVPVNGVYRQCEYILYGYRDRMGINKKGKFLRTIITEKRKKHSEKPGSFYEMLKDNTKQPRIDIFARKKHEGFEAWGDQVEMEMQKTID